VLACAMVRREDQLGARLSELYAYNTLGAVLGAVLSGFVLIGQLGLDGASLSASALNFSVAGLVMLGRRRLGTAERQCSQHSPAADAVAYGPAQLKALLVLVTTGFVAIAVEVAWTKYLAVFVGSTIHGFAAILAAVLLGVALGSWSVRRRVDHLEPERWLAFGLSALGVSLLLTQRGLAQVARFQDSFLESIPFGRYLLVFLVVLPSTWLMGALFPLSLRLMCQGRAALPAHVGQAYAANTLAGVAGSLVAGFFWLPNWGTAHLLLWTAVLILLLPLAFRRSLSGAWALSPLLSFVLALVLLRAFPAPDYRELLHAVRMDRRMSSGSQETVFVEEGGTGVVSLDAVGNHQFKLYTNGLNEARFSSVDRFDATLTESLLGIVPYVLHPEPESAFVVGLGGGATLRALEHSKLSSLRVVELEPLVKDALVSVMSPEAVGLSDPRLTLTFNDARNTLLVEDARYDLIVSQPSHPWRAGAANLFTREFFQIANSRLTPGGIYGQWLGLYRIDGVTLRSILQAFSTVFQQAFALQSPEGDLLLFGSQAPLVFTRSRLYSRLKQPDISQILQRRGVRDPLEILALFALSWSDMRALGAQAPMSTDTNLLPEVRAHDGFASARSEDSPGKALRQVARFDVLPYIDASVQAEWLQKLVRGLSSVDRLKSNYALQQLSRVDPAAARRLAPRPRQQ